METVIFVAVWLFVATHLDTLVVLVAFCADEEYRSLEILLGHYVGFGVGLLAAVVAAIAAADVLRSWTFLLGLIPISIGLWDLSQRRSGTDRTEPRDAPSSWKRIGVVAAAGVGLSGENLAVFIPFFSGLSMSTMAAVVAMYFFGAALVFALALVITREATSIGMPAWVERWLVPAVLIAVGVYILLTGWFLG